MDLSIIIVNWNTRDLLDRCLTAVFATVRRPAEVIVVDNASSDGSADMVAERHPECILFRNAENLGFAEANNQAMRIARGHFILLLNSDTKPLEGCIDGMAGFLQTHPAYGAVACQLVHEDGSLQRSCRRFPSFLTLLAVHTSVRYSKTGQRQLDRLYMRDWDHRTDRDVDQPAAACLLLRAEVPRRVGLFDANCFLLYNDVDLCKRVRAAGYRIAYESRLRTLHKESASLEKYPRLSEEGLRNVMHFVRKHYGPLAAWGFALAVAVDALRLGQRRLLGPLVSA
jgi:hypothetical protein